MSLREYHYISHITVLTSMGFYWARTVKDFFYPVNALKISPFCVFPPLFPTTMSTISFSMVKGEKRETKNML